MSLFRYGVIVFVVVGVLVILSACSNDNPHHLTGGTVVAKGHQDGYTYLIMIPICTPVGKSTICNSIPIYEHQDATWTVTVRDCSTTPDTSATCPVGKLYLTPTEWAGVAVGQQYGISEVDRLNPTVRKVSKP